LCDRVTLATSVDRKGNERCIENDWR
jgi:hypothetical protein